MNEKLEVIGNRIIKQIADNMKAYGYPETIGIVMGTIYYENRPLNLDELAEKTGMSKTRMSQVLREMAKANIAEKVYIKGDRKDYYTVENDYYQTFISLFTSNWNEVITRNVKAANKTLREVNLILEDKNITDEEKQTANLYLQEAKEILAFYDWVKRLTDFLDSGKVFDHIPNRDEGTGPSSQ